MDVINRDQDVAIRDHQGKMASTGKSHGQTPVGKTNNQKATNERRIVIIGKTGSGKSSIGNTIFGEDKFTVCHTSISALSPCQAKTKLLNGREITLIDTPGFFDTNKPEDELKPEIVKCITECSPGPHAFLILLKLERFTKQENDVINQITQFFSEEVFKFATVVFTHGDDLQGQQLKDYASKNPFLSALVEKCGGRCHVIDNRYWKNPSDDPYRSNTHQVEEILKSVEEIVKANNGKCYTNDMLEKVEEMIQQKEKRIAQSSENMSREEIRQKAKGIVCDILNKAAGITTGALLGALFGAAVAVVAVIAVLRRVANTIMTPTKKAGTTGKASSGISGPDIEAIAASVINFAVCAPTAATAAVTAGAMCGTVGVVAAAGVGAYEGYQAAKESETPWEAMKKTAEAVYSTAEDAVKHLEEFSKGGGEEELFNKNK